MDIVCGWGTLAIEIVKQTGCHCTDITLSKQQLKYAQKKGSRSWPSGNISFLCASSFVALCCLTIKS